MQCRCEDMELIHYDEHDQSIEWCPKCGTLKVTSYNHGAGKPNTEEWKTPTHHDE